MSCVRSIPPAPSRLGNQRSPISASVSSSHKSQPLLDADVPGTRKTDEELVDLIWKEYPPKPLVAKPTVAEQGSIRKLYVKAIAAYHPDKVSFALPTLLVL